MSHSKINTIQYETNLLTKKDKHTPNTSKNVR